MYAIFSFLLLFCFLATNTIIAQTADTISLDSLWQKEAIQQVLKLNTQQKATIRLINLCNSSNVIKSNSTRYWSILYKSQLPFDLNMGYYRDIILARIQKKGKCLELDIYTTEFQPTTFPSVRLHLVVQFKKKKDKYILKEISHSQWD